MHYLFWLLKNELNFFLQQDANTKRLLYIIGDNSIINRLSRYLNGWNSFGYDHYIEIGCSCLQILLSRHSTFYWPKTRSWMFFRIIASRTNIATETHQTILITRICIKTHFEMCVIAIFVLYDLRWFCVRFFFQFWNIINNSTRCGQCAVLNIFGMSRMKYHK